MNPVTHTEPNVGQPITTPQKNTQPLRQPLKPTTSALKTEIVNNIPVRAPANLPQGANPARMENPVKDGARTLTQSNDKDEDKELDQILKDVNHKVKVSTDSLDEQFDHLTGVRKKAAIKKAKLDQKHNGAPPIMVTVIACIVALILSASALMMLK